MPLSRIGGSLLRLCRTLVKDCDCCCEPVDIQCQGDAPTVKVFGVTFDLGVFVDAASSPYGVPYWTADAAGADDAIEKNIVGGKVRLHSAALPRIPDTNCVPTVCSFSYNCGHVSLGDYGANLFYVRKYEGETLKYTVEGYVTLLAGGSYSTDPKYSRHYTSVGGHTWTIFGRKLEHKVLPSGISYEEVVGVEPLTFSDGTPCLP